MYNQHQFNQSTTFMPQLDFFSSEEDCKASRSANDNPRSMTQPLTSRTNKADFNDFNVKLKDMQETLVNIRSNLNSCGTTARGISPHEGNKKNFETANFHNIVDYPKE